MAFSPHHTVSSYLINYPASDSDDQLKHHSPRELEIMEAESQHQSFLRSGSRGSLSSDDPCYKSRQSNRYHRQQQQQIFVGRPSSEEETEINYNKFEVSQEFNQIDQYQNYQSEYYDADKAFDPQYSVDADIPVENFLDFVKVEPSYEREQRGGYVNTEMQIENEGEMNYEQDYQFENKVEECGTVYEETTCSNSDFSQRSSQRYSMGIQSQPIYTPGMLKIDEQSNSMMIETSLNENTPQQIQMSIRKNTVRLRELIEGIMQGLNIQEADLQGLNEIERTIISCIREKKFKNIGIKTSKRREEKQKLFFKSALKHIESNFLSNFAKDRNLSRKKDADPLMFYVTYFQDAANAMQIDISNFLPPCQKRKYRAEGREIPNKNELKSFNLKYIELTLSSKRFLADTWKYLECSFIQSYAKSRYQKN